jgi:hypothetical protein
VLGRVRTEELYHTMAPSSINVTRKPCHSCMEPLAVKSHEPWPGVCRWVAAAAGQLGLLELCMLLPAISLPCARGGTTATVSKTGSAGSGTNPGFLSCANDSSCVQIQCLVVVFRGEVPTSRASACVD